ncbi:MAG TPA: hypothetical protein PLC35_04785 [Methanosarcina vacuolata]|nr:hypothetical protein [Methanosarcina vacuolata]
MNTNYRIEIFYSPSKHKTYSSKLPERIKGEFGPGIKSLIITLNHIANVSEPKINEFLENIGVHISKATISRILTKDIDIFHQEKAEIFLEGLKAMPYQQIDDTGARVNGVNNYTEILCNPYYTAYFTVPNKNRETILDVLLCGKEKTYCFNDEAFDLMKTFNVSQRWLEKLSSLKNKIFSDEEMRRKLDCIFLRCGKTTKKKVLEACAIAAYHESKDIIHVVTALLSNDARQFKQVAYQHALCWIHDGRNYKKLRPIVPYHKEKLEAFLDRYWDFYGELREFRIKPDPEVAEHLSVKFDQLFSTKTGYEQLDERIAKTKENKE